MGGFPDPKDAGIICLNFYLYLEPISDLKKASPRAVVFLFLWMGGRFIRFWWCYCSIAVGVFISFFFTCFSLHFNWDPETLSFERTIRGYM
jgi:hypothetical protein